MISFAVDLQDSKGEVSPHISNQSMLQGDPLVQPLAMKRRMEEGEI